MALVFRSLKGSTPPMLEALPRVPITENHTHTHTHITERKNTDRQLWMELIDFTIKTNEADSTRSLQHT